MSSDTLIRDGRSRRRCSGRNGACEREAVLPDGDPFYCRTCALLEPVSDEEALELLLVTPNQLNEAMHKTDRELSGARYGRDRRYL